MQAQLNLIGQFSTELRYLPRDENIVEYALLSTAAVDILRTITLEK